AAVRAEQVPDSRAKEGLPVAVGGSSDGRGVICAANYEARKFGVRSALATAVALRKCPQLTMLTPDMAKYAAESKIIQSIFYQFTDIVEPLSLDEAYLDVSSSKLFQGSASILAHEIRKRIFEQTQLTASAGIASNKFLAKVASDWNKPNGQFVVTPDMVDVFVHKLKVEKIWGVGKVTAEKIHKLNIHTCGELQRLSLLELTKNFGSFGHSLYEMSRGIDHREVSMSTERKSLSIERTFREDLQSIEECLGRIPELFEAFLRRAKGKEKLLEGAKTLFVKIKFNDFKSTTIERSFNSLHPEHFAELLQKGFARSRLPVRLLGMGVRFKSEKKLKANSSQLLLFEN
ncbi:MAG: DNA polymerase IV, partial [Leptospirales bacterium]